MIVHPSHSENIAAPVASYDDKIGNIIIVTSKDVEPHDDDGDSDGDVDVISGHVVLLTNIVILDLGWLLTTMYQ